MKYDYLTVFHTSLIILKFASYSKQDLVMETITNRKTIISNKTSFTTIRMIGKKMLQSFNDVVLQMLLSVFPFVKSLRQVMIPYCKMQSHSTVSSVQLTCCCCQCSLWNQLYQGLNFLESRLTDFPLVSHSLWIIRIFKLSMQIEQ